MFRLLLLAASLVSAQPQTDSLGATFRDFSGGYVDTVESANLQPNQSPSALNVVIDDPAGSIKPRSGITRCGNLPSNNTATNIYQFAKSDGTKNLIVTDNQNVYSTRDCQTYTTIWTGLSSTAQVYFTTVRDKVWIVNGSTWPITWDGSTAVILDGRSNTPASVPKCAYPEFFRERVWCANTSGNPSGLYFSAITDASGNDLDPSTGSLSWPAINLFQINQNGGSSIYGVKSYRDRLYVFKDNGIWEVQFNSEFDNAVRKTYSSVGSRFHTSIAEVDGLLYFVGKDGIYAFDGETSQRISGDIEGKFAALNQPQTNTQYKNWDSAADFAAGTLVNTTTSTTVGSVLLSNLTIPSSINADFERGDSTNWTYATGSDCDSAAYPTSAATASDTTLGGSYVGKFVLPLCVRNEFSACSSPASVCSGSTALKYTILDGNGAVVLGPTEISAATTTVNLSSLTTNYIRVKFSATDACGVNGQSVAGTMVSGFVTGSSITFRYSSTSSGSQAACGSTNDYAVTYKVDDIRNLSATTTGYFRTEVFNLVSVSSHGVFNATSVDNGGSIVYQYHVGHDTLDISTKPWTTIVPGASVQGTSSDIYIQFNSSFTASASGVSPELQLEQFQYSQGGSASTKLYSFGWKNRLWISASSGTATTNNLVLVKTRLPRNAWMPYDLKIGAMAVFNDNFYAAASTHSAIYRIDYGTNDDGRAIPWFWETRDELWQAPNAKKYLTELNADFKKGTAANVSLGYSSDYGATYSNRTVDMSGSGRGSTVQYVNGGLSLSYRLRLL
jgi:hypothetical protein